MTTPEWAEMYEELAEATTPSKPPLKSLDQFNEDKRRVHRLATEPHANGIACPKCGEELWDSNPMSVLTTYPPKMNVHCPACDYRGYRVA